MLAVAPYAVRPAAAIVPTFAADVEAVLSIFGSHAGSALRTTRTSFVRMGRDDVVVTTVGCELCGAFMGWLDVGFTMRSRPCALTAADEPSAKPAANNETAKIFLISVK